LLNFKNFKGLNEDDDEDGHETTESSDDRLELPTALPTFSKKIESNLVIGDFWTNDSTRYQFISELAVFFKTNNILLSNSMHYKAVGVTVLAKYENFARAMNKLCDKENKGRLNKENSKRIKLIQPWVRVVEIKEIFFINWTPYLISCM
jgi:hypothetical protein